MKRSLNFVLLLMLTTVFACNDKTTDAGATASGGISEAHKQMMESNRAVQRAIETGDSVTLRKYISAESVDHGGGPNGEDVKGDDIVRMLSSIHKDIDNMKFETLQEAANEDHVFALVRLTGTTNKAVWGMPAGHKMDSKSVDVVKIKDGKMTDHWGYYDMAEMMAMMGGAQGGGNAPAAKK